MATRFQEASMNISKRYKGAVATTLLAGFVGALHCLGGCSTSTGIETAGKKTLERVSAPDPAKCLIFHDRGVAGNVEIADMKITKAGDLLKVEALLRISPHAKDPDIVPLLYMFVWFDAEGKEITSGANAWQPLMIFGRDIQKIQGVATDPRAREFKLKIRSPDNSHC
jgi:uncharacterized protein YcfL